MTWTKNEFCLNRLLSRSDRHRENAKRLLPEYDATHWLRPLRRRRLLNEADREIAASEFYFQEYRTIKKLMGKQ